MNKIHPPFDYVYLTKKKCRENVAIKKYPMSPVEAGAVHSGTKLYDSYLNLFFDYSQSNLSSGVTYSRLFLPNISCINIKTREELWNKLSLARVNDEEKILIDIRIEFPLSSVHSMRIHIIEEFIGLVQMNLFSADVNIHTHKKESPHAHFLIPLFSLNENGFNVKKISSFLRTPESVNECRAKWDNIVLTYINSLL